MTNDIFMLYIAVLKYGCGIRVDCIECLGNHFNEYCVVIKREKEDFIIV